MLRLFPVEKSFLYHDTYNSLENYNLILGDSHVFGIGDSLLNQDYNYSIGHQLYLLTKKKDNFINVGIPGAGSKISYFYAENFIKKKKGNLKRILFVFYEGNDLTDNINFKKNKNKKIKLKLRIFLESYFPIYHIFKNSRHKLFGKKEKKQINLQTPAMELDVQNIELSIKIFFDTILKLKNFSENISIAYIPSPATVYSKNSTYAETLMGKNNHIYSKSDIQLRSKQIREKIKKFCKNNNILFLDTTETLNINSTKKNIYGPKDLDHPNKYGYELISGYIYKNFNFDN